MQLAQLYLSADLTKQSIRKLFTELLKFEFIGPTMYIPLHKRFVMNCDVNCVPIMRAIGTLTCNLQADKYRINRYSIILYISRITDEPDKVPNAGGQDSVSIKYNA